VRPGQPRAGTGARGLSAVSCRSGAQGVARLPKGFLAHDLPRTLVTTLCPRKNAPPPKHALKFSKLASCAQFQFNNMNICLFSIKVPILVKICPTVIEILTFNKCLKSLPFPEA